MGKILQIRVMAYTYDETEVVRAWPKLCALAFPDTYPAPAEHTRKGVGELVDSLTDQIRFDMVDESVKNLLKTGTQAVHALKQQMDQALADWNPREANRLSDDIEQALDELEKEASRI